MRVVVVVLVVVGGAVLLWLNKFTLGWDPEPTVGQFFLLLDFGYMNCLWGGIQQSCLST